MKLIETIKAELNKNLANLDIFYRIKEEINLPTSLEDWNRGDPWNYSCIGKEIIYFSAPNKVTLSAKKLNELMSRLTPSGIKATSEGVAYINGEYLHFGYKIFDEVVGRVTRGPITWHTIDEELESKCGFSDGFLKFPETCKDIVKRLTITIYPHKDLVLYFATNEKTGFLSHLHSDHIPSHRPDFKDEYRFGCIDIDKLKAALKIPSK